MTAQPQRQTICDERICVRLPRTLVETISKECDRTDTTLSSLTRTALVEFLSRGMKR
jgi:hypothetical protein